MRTTLNTLGWALFLAVSWTWCIGMYLPTLLVRDGGIPFFLAFLIPNVLGAASVGWLLASRGASAGFVARLRPVLIAFTVVTVAFHGYFLAWQGGLSVTGGDPDLLVGLVVGASLVLNAVAARGRADWVGALVALFFSLACSGRHRSPSSWAGRPRGCPWRSAAISGARRRSRSRRTRPRPAGSPHPA
jgi:hypothetical protein